MEEETQPAPSGDAAGADEGQNSAEGGAAEAPAPGSNGSAGGAAMADGSRDGLLRDREGFGEATTGGLAGDEYVVTNLQDSGSGSLRAGAEARGPRWISFAEDLTGTIRLSDDIAIAGDKTIDGRGADITIADGALRAEGDNIIIAFLKFANTADDAISFYGGRRNGWIHHNTFFGRGPGEADGAIDLAKRSTDITVSWNRFENWDKTSLAIWENYNGERFSGTKSQFTYHHNYFKDSRQRQPLVRSAQVHSFNNWFESFGAEGTGVASAVCNEGELFSERNVYDDTHNRPAIKTERNGSDCSIPGWARSSGDMLTGDPELQVRSPDQVFSPSRFYDYNVEPAGEALRDTLGSKAGWQPVGVRSGR